VVRHFARFSEGDLDNPRLYLEAAGRRMGGAMVWRNIKQGTGRAEGNTHLTRLTWLKEAGSLAGA